MAVCNSVVPLLWMAVRDVTITGDDLSYAVVLWKYLALYAVVRGPSAPSGRPAVPRGVDGLGGRRRGHCDPAVAPAVRRGHAADSLYAPFGDTSVLTANRGSATLGLAAATADLMIFNLALAVGCWWRSGLRPGDRRPPRRAGPRDALLRPVLRVIGLVVAIVALGVVFRRADVSIILGGLGLGAALPLAPVITTRLVAFGGATGLPESWVGRLDNLRGYFWPRLLEDHNYLLGVQPSARVPSPDTLALP